jgi:signal transduction histidine kinase
MGSTLGDFTTLAQSPAELGTPQPFDERNLLWTVAHELRTPLASLMTSSELLARDLEVCSNEQIRAMVGSIYRGSLWIQGLVDNLLCAASIIQGRFTVQPEPTDMATPLEDIRPVLEPLLGRKRQRLRLVRRGDGASVAADRRRLGQVFVNLIGNAIQFAPLDSVIDVSIKAHGDAVRVTVADRGLGLSRDQRQHLFEPFRQSPGSRGYTTGVGLGLTIVRAIVEAHGGSVGAQDRRRGGARFWFEIPRRVVRRPKLSASVRALPRS